MRTKSSAEDSASLRVGGAEDGGVAAVGRGGACHGVGGGLGGVMFLGLMRYLAVWVGVSVAVVDRGTEPGVRAEVEAGLEWEVQFGESGGEEEEVPHYRAEGVGGLRPVVRRGGRRIANPEVKESSSLQPSRRRPGVFWTLNDSGHDARLFALKAEGSTVGPEEGWRVPGAVNVDWEAMTALPDGRLVIGDIGNNANRRQNLALYLWPEPDPEEGPTGREPEAERVAFYYADQDGFPPVLRNYDAEALFYMDGKVHLLTKHRSDGWTTLYRFDEMKGGGDALGLWPVARFWSPGMVTGAAMSSDGRWLAVLTYAGVWVLERDAGGGSLFEGSARWAAHLAGQCEGVAWKDEQTLLISNEAGWLYEVAVESLPLLGRVVRVAEKELQRGDGDSRGRPERRAGQRGE